MIHLLTVSQGTWTKISDSINGRRPFQRDDEIIDYDHNSEAEWEPEGEGEDIQSGDEDEEDLGVDMADPDDVSGQEGQLHAYILLNQISW